MNEGKELDENKSENSLNANLLTNYEATVLFMQAIEGDTWPGNQPQGLNIKYCLTYVMNWLKDSTTPNQVTTLYGWEGGDRYAVHKDGSVKFKKGFSTSRTLEIAKGIGFPIDES
jgi:hypothetical protein